MSEAAYVARLQHWRAELARHERAHALAGRTRFAIAAAGALVLLVWGWAALPVVGGLFIVFIGMVVRHARVLEARDRAARAVQWCERGLARVRHEWIGRGDGGDRFEPPDHLYAADLDLFGRGSAFELLSTARTQAGQSTLASWLLAPAPPDEARARQAAVRELAARPDLRETMAIEGEGVHMNTMALRQWATAPTRLPAGPLPWLLGLLAATNIGLLIWFIATWELGRLWAVVAAVQGVVGLVFFRRVAEVIGAVETPTRDLTVVAALLRVLEGETFTAPALQALQAEIRGSSRAASAEIAHLERLVARLAWRRDIIFVIPALLMMWETQCALAIDRWRRRVGVRVPAWLDAIGAFESLSALATFAGDNPSHVYPELGTGTARLAATALAHPLLPASAVPNDVALGADAPALLVVSGSNMSGKSTLLRAIGVNVVLAQAGAPVRATNFTLTPLAIGASIRILDSLQDGRSRFFAEITRLEKIVRMARAHRDGVLFLLDEILSGTNSHDRAHGAGALLAGLLREDAIGLVTTHDLALSQIGDTLAPRAANVHFADEFDAGGLSFDFHLRPGPVRTSNALALMRSIGLDV